MSRIIHPLARAVVGSLLSLALAAALACANPGAPAATATPVPAAATPTLAAAAATPTTLAPAAATPPPAPTATPIPTATPTPTPTLRPTATPRNSGGDDGGDSPLSRLGDGVRDTFRSSSCRVSSQNKIAWEQKPTLSDDGWLEMSGRTKDGARIHDPTAGATGGQNWPAFNLNNLRESSGLRLEAVGSIYPASMSSRLGPGSLPLIFADDADYRVTATEFYVRAKLPDYLLSRNIRLVVVVWPANPGFQSPALAAECVRPE